MHDIVADLVRQPASFWLICTYMFLEYVRPQQIYNVIEGLPLPEVTLVLCIVALAMEGKVSRRFNWADSALITFGAILLVSSILAWNPDYSFRAMKVVINWLLVYYLVTQLVDSENRLIIFMLAFLLYSLKMAQHGTRSWASIGFQFRDWGVTGAPGWFHNSGEFAVQMTIFVPLSIYFILALKKYWQKWKLAMFMLLPISGVLGVLASSSRGGQLGMAAAFLVIAMKSQQKLKGVVAVSLVAVTAFLLTPEAQRERFSTIGEDWTSQSRLTYWEHGLEIMNDYPVLGVGYNNWLPYYRRHYDPEGQVPHSIYIEAGAELGYPGLVAFLMLIGATLVLNRRTRSLVRRCRGDPAFLENMAHGLDAALAGFLVSGAFVTVLYYPFFWVNLAMASALYSVAQEKARRDRVLHGIRPAALSPTVRGEHASSR